MSNKTHATWSGFVFELGTIPLGERTHITTARLAEQPHLGQAQGWQFLGRGEERVVLTGYLAPASQIGKASAIAQLRGKLEEGEPKPLILSPTGKSLGEYFLQNVEQRDSQLYEGYGFGVAVTLTFVRDGN